MKIFLREGQVCAYKSPWASHMKEYFRSFSFKFSCSGQYCSWWKKGPAGVTKVGFCNIQFFKPQVKLSVSWFKFTISGHQDSRAEKRALHELIYYCPTITTPHLQERLNRSVICIWRASLLALSANNPLFFRHPESISIALACLKVTSFASKQSSWITFIIFFFFSNYSL